VAIPLRTWRERKLLTQRELAAQSGVGLATIARIELGHPARLSTVRRLAAALGIKGEQLVAGSVPAAPG
jgi:transcriptional regulator with XRE-family HTH domain